MSRGTCRLLKKLFSGDIDTNISFTTNKHEVNFRETNHPEVSLCFNSRFALLSSVARKIDSKLQYVKHQSKESTKNDDNEVYVDEVNEPCVCTRERMNSLHPTKYFGDVIESNIFFSCYLTLVLE